MNPKIVKVSNGFREFNQTVAISAMLTWTCNINSVFKLYYYSEIRNAINRTIFSLLLYKVLADICCERVQIQKSGNINGIK